MNVPELPVKPGPQPAKPPTWLFVLHLVYIGVLVGLAILYANSSDLRSTVHDPVGPLPLAVPWWGALGGVTIGLTGVFKHSQDWDVDFERWHIARPVLGAIVGSVGCLIFVVVLRASGSDTGAGKAAGGGLFDLVAFLVGYREEIFRQLIKRATDTLFARRALESPHATKHAPS
jgi:hypothetical protein